MPLNDYSWDEFFPRHLTQEERENPHQVIDNFFSYAHLPDIREMLWELINTAVTGNYCKMQRRERSDMLFSIKSWKNSFKQFILFIKDRMKTIRNKLIKLKNLHPLKLPD